MSTILTNITKCWVIKKVPPHIMLKLPTNQVIFYPSRFIKIHHDKSLEIIFFDDTKYRANRAKQEGKKWVRYDHQDLKSEEIVKLILEHDEGAKKC